MKRNELFIIICIVFFNFSCNRENNENRNLLYPETKKVQQTDVYFGNEIQDPYRWLENDTSQETSAWVKSQNDLTFGYLAGIPYRDSIRSRLTKIWDYPKRSAPIKEGSYYFEFRNDGLQNQDILYFRKDLTSEPAILLDPNKLSDDGTVSLSRWDVSSDGKYFAYAISKGGSDWMEVFIKNIETGELLPDHIQWVKFSGISFFKNGFFYSSYKKPGKGTELSLKNEYHKVYYHKIGSAQEQDELIFEDKNYPLRNYYSSVTKDNKYLVIYETESTHGNAVYVSPLNGEKIKLKKIIDGFNYENDVIDNHEGRLLVLTNCDAPKYRLVSIEPDKPEKENWNVIIPEKENVLQSCQVTGNRIIALYMKDACSKAEIYNLQGKYEKDIELPGLGTINGFYGEKDCPEAYFSFSSFTVPNDIYKYDIPSYTSTLFYETKVDYDKNQFVTKQEFYKSKDGTRVPIFIVHKKGIQLDGTNPAFLYAYGGFNVSMNPGFKVSRILWLENGGVFALPNIRGGGEYGEEWHMGGMKLKKQNVFDDFIAAAEYLVEKKYTSKGRIVIQGGSNGGLLIGAVVNQRPDLYKVALPAVGVMDMLRFHKFTIGWAWVGEYGSSEDSADFFNIIRYSPLHNIKENVNYPAVMVTTADHDDRVVPAHSFKYIATLQEKYKGSNPVLIRIETMAGHGSGKPTSKRIEEETDSWSFVFYNLGITPRF